MFGLPDLPDGVLMPPHAYVPGKTARHREDWFDVIKASVTPDVATCDLHHTTAFAVGMVYFDSGYFWECHEVLEPVWMATPERSAERDMVQAVIQLANARLKLRMDRPNAASRLCSMVRAHLYRCPKDAPTLGLHVADMHEAVSDTFADVKKCKIIHKIKR